jgi:hypothetical protein
MANEEHVKRLRQGAKAWNTWRRNNPTVRPDLRGADLRDANLRGAKLSRADLRDANLPRAHLSDANLRGAELHLANLIRVQLSHADLSSANLGGAILSLAYLDDANLSDAELSDARLYSADLRGANLTRANLTRANLRDATLIGAKLEGAVLEGTILPEGYHSVSEKRPFTSHPEQKEKLPPRALAPSSGRGPPIRTGPLPPSKIFISYRRDESKYQARMIYEAFCHALSRERVFIDIDSIPVGVNFRKILKDEV